MSYRDDNFWADAQADAERDAWGDLVAGETCGGSGEVCVTPPGSPLGGPDVVEVLADCPGCEDCE